MSAATSCRHTCLAGQATRPPPLLSVFFHIYVFSILSLPQFVCLGPLAQLNQEVMTPSYLK